MPRDHQKLVQQYVDVWNETDADRRQSAIDALYTEDCGYTDPLAAVAGRAALSAFIGGVQSHFPGARFRLAGAVDAHHDQARFRWEAALPGSEPVAIGFDVAIFDGERIRTVYGFLDKAPS